MSIARVTTWNSGDVLTAAALNAEFNNILNNPISLWSPAAQNVSFNGKVVTWDGGAVTTSNSTAASGLLFSPGGKTGTPGVTAGSQLDIGTQTFTDTNTASSGTATSFAGTIVHAPTLSASNTLVTTTDAASFYVDGPVVAGTHETLTNAWAAWFNGNVRIAGTLKVATFDASVVVPVANGGTGDATLTAYAVLCGGATTTNPVQSIASVGTAKQVLTSNGAGTLPTMQTSPGVLLFGSPYSSTTTTDPTFISVGTVYGSEVNVVLVMPRAGTLQNFYIRSGITITGGTKATVRLNGADTALVITINAASTYYSDTTHTAAFVAGDRFDLKVSGATGGDDPLISWSLEYTV